ncbi:hypothetical protein [Streptomyces sp. SAI-127]|uniref:hypothetical protein n=1 Tax=Streptomyces sp. SAI-127 TaxID=2940543 RepID=UPI002474AB29|nr:hypothetical protein [Streptomyces sp. SAI-127]MDH6489623.1 hypothetical protein [Streptomyces sp. SAI-127]
MNATTTTSPAQVGKGRTVHQVPTGEMVTLCGSTATSLLAAAEAQKGKACAKCTKIAALRTAEAAPEAPAAEETPAAEQAPTEAAPAVEATPVWRTLKGAGTDGAFMIYGDLHEARGKLIFTSWGTAKQIKGQPYTFTRQWSGNRGFNRYLEDTEGRTVEFNGGMATRVWMVDGIPAPAADVAEQAPADEQEAPEVPAVQEATEVDDAPAEVAEPAEAEEAPEADDAPVEEAPETEDAPAEPVQVTAYTAALEALHINGKDNDDRTLTLDASTVQETVAAMRRMPRWNAAQERFTVNKVALIVARSAEGERVWVRGEAAPIRVDFAGNPIAEDAPAEPGTVDMAAVLAATRVLRRRAEVQRVIASRTASTPAEAPTA